jgi:hypothetical protein
MHFSGNQSEFSRTKVNIGNHYIGIFEGENYCKIISLFLGALDISFNLILTSKNAKRKILKMNKVVEI